MELAESRGRWTLMTRECFGRRKKKELRIVKERESESIVCIKGEKRRKGTRQKCILCCIGLGIDSFVRVGGPIVAGIEATTTTCTALSRTRLAFFPFFGLNAFHSLPIPDIYVHSWSEALSIINKHSREWNENRNAKRIFYESREREREREEASIDGRRLDWENENLNTMNAMATEIN